MGALITDHPMAHDPANRGYVLLYRENEVNHCPSCGRSSWYIGRASAECAFCRTTLALPTAVSGSGVYFTRGTTA